MKLPYRTTSYICIVSTAKKYRTIITFKDYFEVFLSKQRCVQAISATLAFSKYTSLGVL